MNTPLRCLISGFTASLIMCGESFTAQAQESIVNCNNSASEKAGRRYEAAGEYYRGGNPGPISRSEDVMGSPIPNSQPNSRLESESIAYDSETNNPGNVPELYQTIVERNSFGLLLKSNSHVKKQSIAASTPKQDLILTGLVDIGEFRCALFKIVESGKSPLSFVLKEKDQNEWLEIHSVDALNGTVKAYLKKSVMRIPNAGTEVVLSIQANGTQH